MSRDLPPDHPDAIAWLNTWRPRLLEAHALLLLDHHGVRTPTLNLLRRRLANASATLVVARNDLTRLAIANTPLAPLTQHLQGPSALVLVEHALSWSIPRILRILQQDNTPPGQPHGPQPTLRTAWLNGQRYDLAALRKKFLAAHASSPPPIDLEHIPPPQPSDHAWLCATSTLNPIRTHLRDLLQGPPALAEQHVSTATRLVILDPGPSPLQVVRCLRHHLSLSEPLRETLHRVRHPPIHYHVEPGDHPTLIDALLNLGATLEPPPEPAPTPQHGWIPWTLHTDAIFERIPGIRLRPGWTLGARAYREGGNGHGETWAQPPNQHTRLPVSAAFEATHDGPQPRLMASLLRRELHEFAALWHGVSWGTHHLVDTLPPPTFDTPLDPRRQGTPDAWSWQTFAHPEMPSWRLPEPATRNWLPRVEPHTEGWVVSFTTLSGLGSMRLVLHLEHYNLTHLTPTHVQSITIASAGGGYVF